MTFFVYLVDIRFERPGNVTQSPSNIGLQEFAIWSKEVVEKSVCVLFSMEDASEEISERCVASYSHHVSRTQCSAHCQYWQCLICLDSLRWCHLGCYFYKISTRRSGMGIFKISLLHKNRLVAQIFEIVTYFIRY